MLGGKFLLATVSVCRVRGYMLKSVEVEKGLIDESVGFWKGLEDERASPEPTTITKDVKDVGKASQLLCDHCISLHFTQSHAA